MPINVLIQRLILVHLAPDKPLPDRRRRALFDLHRPRNGRERTPSSVGPDVDILRQSPSGDFDGGTLEWKLTQPSTWGRCCRLQTSHRPEASSQTSSHGRFGTIPRRSRDVPGRSRTSQDVSRRFRTRAIHWIMIHIYQDVSGRLGRLGRLKTLPRRY